MLIANYLLLALGVMGGIDILLYHSISHGIRTHAESRWELVTHAMRGPTYTILFLVVPNFETRGVWALLMALLLIFDVGISVADFWLERRSRAELGGLPSGEYVLHMIMAMLFGAFVMAASPSLLEWMAQPTALVATGAHAASGLRMILAIFAAGVLWSGAMDLRAALHEADPRAI
ncbi:MAG TPA: hypothetical protein VM680_05280 [Verrucomicrobiae bacterium]|nr:hypothetical protein [Verrucomicrobiae bacterium]